MEAERKHRNYCGKLHGRFVLGGGACAVEIDLY